ncbi:DENN domain-containing protein 1A isoform X4 [Colius striatus]|uniref:DENN domain-containing protein 1A isoform X4 n=1 Tax=Colius striatus TaxID=57412 RepID=UPI002B1CF42E|nr:DENN domain-containing protein 1A isoform X4 [Colius striatus]
MGSRIKQNPETTFEVYAEVTYSGIGCTGKDPEVRRQFPEGYSDQEVLQTLTKFCFPFYVDSHAVNQVGQNFTFVLTDIDSKQRFGFCRLSSGAKSCFCILSYLPWFEVFYKLLNVLADYSAKGQDSQRSELLETFHKLTIPEPGTSVHLGVHSYFTVPDIRELPSIPENRNLTEYFVAVDVNNMLHLYASMLYERRILICCSKLSTLTACIHGSAAMLYPMFWQHVYIPVLPPHLLDYCCAPMPYLIGIHLSLMEKVRNMALEDVVILNVDTNTLETPFDDLQSLPNDVVSALKNRLKKVSTTTGDGVARAFLKAQASFFGSYRNALKIEPVRPPRPHVVKRPKSNIGVEGRRTSVSSPEQPQPYRALKESDSADGEEAISPERSKEPLPPSPLLSSKATEINLLEDIFPNLEVEAQPQPLSQAKSLEDLRTPKEEGEQRCTFDYQRMDLGVSERNRMVPAMKLSHPYSKLWSMGHDDMAIPTKYSQSSPERPLPGLGNKAPGARRPRSRDSILAPAEKDESNPAIQGNITIPRPQGRKTPELGIVPPPPAPRASKQQTPAGPTDALAAQATARSHLVSELIPEPFGVGSVSFDPEIQPSSHPSQLLSSAASTAEMLQPVKVKTDNTGNEGDYLLNLLDPLKTGSWQSSGPQQGPHSLQSSATPPSPASFVSVASDFVPPPAAPFVQPLGFSSPAPPAFLQPSPNPFTQTMPGALSVSLVRPPRGSFTPSLGHAYSSSFIAPNSSFYPPQRPQPNISTLSMPNLFSQAPAVPAAGSLLLQSHCPSPASSLQPVCLSGPSKPRTLQVGQPGSKVDPKQALALLSNEAPLLPSRPAKGLESVLLSSKCEETKDPFEDLLKKTKQEVSPTPGKVEQLRKRWETFE